MRYINVRIGDKFISASRDVFSNQWCEGCRCFHMARIVRWAFSHRRQLYVAIDEVNDGQWDVWCWIPKTGEVALVRFEKPEGLGMEYAS